MIVPGPFPVTLVFRMLKAAPLSRIPPPELLVTAHVSISSVTALPPVGAALIPIPVDVPPWMVRLRR